MDWTVYWFQGIACFVFASAAMFSGITGAGWMFPWFLAAASSIVLVAVAKLSASATHLVQFARDRGLGEIPWNPIVWGVPGMAVGALLGSHLQGRVSERAAKWFFAGLSVVISLAFLVYTLTGES